MNIKSLQNLIKLDTESGEAKINIAIPSFKIAATSSIISVHYVQPYQIMRPDLISLQYYGTTEYIDIILKANSISNPFCIKEGMILLIPEITGAVRNYKPISKNLKPRTQFQDIKRITPIDKKRLQFLAQKSSAKNNGSSENLPPNMLKTNQQSKVIKSNEIILGANMNIKTS
jgi:hypothetical protein